MEEKNKVKRFDITRALLTISQTGEFDLENVRDILLKRFEDIRYMCISREKHEVKGLHCHIFLDFEKRKKFHDKSFDFIFNKHANIKQVKQGRENYIRCSEYVKKCQDYIEYGEKELYVRKSDEKTSIEKKDMRRYVIKMIQEGISLQKLLEHENETVRSYALDHSRHIRNMIYEYENHMLLKEFHEKKGIQKIENNDESGKKKDLYKKINESIEFKWERPFKSKNLHLWSSEPNMGKSTLVQKIMKYSACYIFPPDGWFTRYYNYTYQFIIWDEMNLKGLKPSFLNLFLEGSKCQLPVKGDLTHKWDNPLVIMLSNKPLREHLKYIKSGVDREIYKKTLSARVLEIEVKNGLFDVIEKIIPNN